MSDFSKLIQKLYLKITETKELAQQIDQFGCEKEIDKLEKKINKLINKYNDK